MPIPFDPITIPEVPAVPAKTISAGWLRRLLVYAFDTPNPDNSRDRIEIEVCGMTHKGEIVHDEVKSVTVNLWEVANLPEVQQAMGAVLAVVPILQAFAAEKKAKAIKNQPNP